MVRQNLAPLAVMAVTVATACNLVLGLEDATLLPSAGADASSFDGPLIDGPLADGSGLPAEDHRGLVSIFELTKIDGVTGAPTAESGGYVDVRFAPYASPPTCQGAGTAPCELGTYPPVNDCHTLIEAKAARAPGISVGDLQITSRVGSGPDAGFLEPASSAIPPCQLRNGEYYCIHSEGIDGDTSASGLVDPNAAFSSADVGRRVVVFAGGTTGSRMITGVTSATTLQTSGGLPPGTGLTWYVVAGGEPTATAAPFLRQTDELLVSYPGAAPHFGAQVDRGVLIGDTFSLTPATEAILASLDNRADIAARTAPFLLTCTQCTATTAAATYLVLEAETDTERITMHCGSPGATSVQVFEAHWELIRTRAAALSRVRVMMLRPGISQSANPPPAAPNQLFLLAGHGYVREVFGIPESD
jgi:hypothetical protein